ncbi:MULTISPECIES: glycosyltransferase family 2 protein [Clostridium]|uniref:glycosyltransferase family 2 protein n=1 Tax=Clostridium TaxID=1485 RepID=UPI002105B7A5|nr:MULTISPECIES: glycosyltransferase family 2 protein [Clostridium]MBS4840269.1 glycosyltransferase family 2 protein [Clostridium sp.]MCQ2018551.1 glycosyltransferase [Clostridium butyricum]MDU1401656.1 glycosyltransferase family 2 protein [Clostridium sp.]MDU1601462.1 glycosyltransferase family 2 protein [Clostridium sp.]MDU2894609.1 glycosyltransferase family 2 protein [Clostridium sp.]
MRKDYGLVSILVPMLNMQLYIEKCLESLVNQTYKNIEVIVIDNNSEDRSIRIVEDYIKRDNRVRLVTKEKTYSVGHSRNIGLDEAKGDYIWFVDSDDYAEHNFLEVMLKKMDEANVDIVQSCYFTFDDFGNEKDTLPYHEDKIYSGRELCVFMQDFVGLSGPNTMLWNKVFRKSVFDGFYFYENRAFEDMCLTYKIFYKQERILWISDRLMHWRKNASSATSRFNYRDFYIHELYAYVERAGFFKSVGDEENYKLLMKRILYVSTQHLYLFNQFIDDKILVRKNELWLKVLIIESYNILKTLNMPFSTRLRMEFIKRFPRVFGYISVKYHIDLKK